MMKIADRIDQLVQEGNIRRIVVIRDGQTVAQLPLTVAAIGAVLAPALAVAGWLAALISHSNIKIELVDRASLSPTSAGGTEHEEPGARFEE